MKKTIKKSVKKTLGNVPNSKMKPHIEESYRYLDNANDIIKNNLKIIDGRFYNDKKYVKIAGHTAYLAILEALKPIIEKPKGEKKINVDYYTRALSKRSKTINRIFESAYTYLHIYMGYEGDLSLELKKIGFKYAKEIIEWADANTTVLGGVKK